MHKSHSEGLQHLNAKKLNLSNNRLFDKGSLMILQGMSKTVQELDLS